MFFERVLLTKNEGNKTCMPPKSQRIIIINNKIILEIIKVKQNYQVQNFQKIVAILDIINNTQLKNILKKRLHSQ